MNVIELHGVSVSYRAERIRSLKQAVIHALAGRRGGELFYGLRDVTLAIRGGESVGIIGRNGAGKSTLLRVAAGVIPPSDGTAITRGTLAPIIELGTGFEAELSGRENIFFNGALLGLSRAFMRRRVDEVIDFAGIEPFIDAPLRTYSTGMVARLAFAVATSVEAETILLDEVLAVGDAAFRRRCTERIERFVKGGATVVVVSHELDTLNDLCARAVWVDGGRVVDDGAAGDVIARYEQSRAP